MIEQSRRGSRLSELSRRHGCSHEAIRKWRKQADLDEGLRHDGLTSSARIRERKRRRDMERQEEQIAIQRKVSGWQERTRQRGKKAKYQFIKENRDNFKVVQMCKMLEVSSSGYYAWLTRVASAMKQRDAELQAKIRASFEVSRRTYGPKRLRQELHNEERTKIQSVRTERE